MRTKPLFGILCLFLCVVSFISCSDDDENKEPEGSVTLNMMDEENGKTLLGVSDVYINKSNNFKTSSCFIVDMGKASGLGVSTKEQLENLSQEIAVVPNHLYHVYDKRVMGDFPSGSRAILMGTAYYKVYVMAPITREGITTGALVKYVLAYPQTNGLPQEDQVLGKLNYNGDYFEYALPKDAELKYSAYLDQEKRSFDIQLHNGKLKITLLKEVDRYVGPYGEYGISVRSGFTYTNVNFRVGMD